MARLTGLEPATPGVTGRYSNQLSYNRAFAFLATALALAEGVLLLHLWRVKWIATGFEIICKTS